MTGNLFDLVCIGIIAVCVLMATLHGFVTELFDKLAFIGALVVAVLFTVPFRPAVTAFVKNPIVGTILAFVIIFVAVFLAIKIIQELLVRIFSAHILKSLDHALGFLFGILEGCIIVSCLLYIGAVQPWFDTDALFSGSFFYALFTALFPGVYGRVGGILSDV